MVERMLRIKRVPTVVSNYQKDEAGGEAAAAGGCGRSCLKSCCIQGWFFCFCFFFLVFWFFFLYVWCKVLRRYVIAISVTRSRF